MSIEIIHKCSFGRPVIGPKHYVTIGASGWAETFPRKDADAALKAYIGSLAISELVDNFLDWLCSKDRRANWSDITGYLSRVFSIETDNVPMDVGVAFWAQAIMLEAAKDTN